MTGPFPFRGREAGGSQSRKARDNLGPRDDILHQIVSSLPVGNQVFLGSWTVDICQVGRSQTSAPQRRHTAHLRRCAGCTPRKQSGRDEEVISHSDRARQTPDHLSCSDLGRAQNAGPMESEPLRTTEVPEPEQLRPGKCIQPRAGLRRFPAEQPRA